MNQMMNQTLSETLTSPHPASPHPASPHPAAGDAAPRDALPPEASPPESAPPQVTPIRFAKPQRIAFVQSCWHRDIVAECRIAFVREIEARGILPSQVDVFDVPGAFEIPLHAQLLAKTRRYTGIVAAGLVVDGGIYRHDFVAGTVIDALMEVQLRTEIPVFSAVLTPQLFHEHATHFEFFRKHFAIKGAEVADACASTLYALERLGGQVAAGIG